MNTSVNINLFSLLSLFLVLDEYFGEYYFVLIIFTILSEWWTRLWILNCSHYFHYF